jgi:hypothetical protein
VRVTVEAGSGGPELGRFVAIGPSSFALPPASYRVTVSRGMEHDVFQQDVELVAGATADVTAVLDRVVDTTGWVAGDFHLHTEASTDSFHAIDNALRIMAGEGLEVVASTDHDYINDYALRTAAAGVDGWLITVNGIEISHPFIAHIGSYPARRDTSRAGAGAPVWFDMNHSELLDAARSIGDPALGGALVQLNHPRRDRNGLFQWMELDPVTLMAGATPESLGLPADTVLEDFDFDVIEIVNKSPDDEDDRALVDYLALYAMGHRFTGMGNSDSHSPNDSNIAGSPRTYVRVPDDARGAFTWDDVAASLRARAVTLGGGIFVTAEIAGPVASGMLPLAVQVQAAPWVDVDQVVVYAGTGMALTVPVTGTGVTRLDETLMVPVGTASFVLVRAEGDRAMPPALRFEPFGMTNPIDIPGR